MSEEVTTYLTYAETKEHSDRDDLYMVIHGKVYDCTKFVDEHPGGEEVLTEVGGVDATDVFEDVGHSDEARKILDDLFVADLHPDEVVVSTKAAPSGGSSSSSSSSGSSFLVLISLVVLGVAGYFAYQQTVANSSE
ncbi:cytochrome b5 [Lipomyces oligophaga]|uniref:cytochrome b5 n=1 Tax=Lipomyces oligophaga TaxID=45792 RepID=UPI0034D00A76